MHWEPRKRTPNQLENATQGLRDIFLSGLEPDERRMIALTTNGHIQIDIDQLSKIRIQIKQRTIYPGMFFGGEVQFTISPTPQFACQIFKALPERYRAIFCDILLDKLNVSQVKKNKIAEKITNPETSSFTNLLKNKTAPQGSTQRLKDISHKVLRQASELSLIPEETVLANLTIQRGTPAWGIRESRIYNIGIDLWSAWDIYSPYRNLIKTGSGHCSLNSENYQAQNLINRLPIEDRAVLAEEYAKIPVLELRHYYDEKNVTILEKLKDRLIGNILEGNLSTDWPMDQLEEF